MVGRGMRSGNGRRPAQREEGRYFMYRKSAGLTTDETGAFREAAAGGGGRGEGRNGEARRAASGAVRGRSGKPVGRAARTYAPNAAGGHAGGLRGGAPCGLRGPAARERGKRPARAGQLRFPSPGSSSAEAFFSSRSEMARMPGATGKGAFPLKASSSKAGTGSGFE